MTTDATTSDRSAPAAKVAERIRKLFAKAESVAGTPEGEVLLERAYALLAKYGVEEAMARSSGEVDPAEIVTGTVVVTGPYRPDQVGLVGVVCRALHCEAVATPEYEGARTVHVVGARRHVERVEMLAGVLCGVMLAAASRLRPVPGVPTVSHRKSFMTGFTFEVGRRLAAAEATAVEASADSPGASIVLRSDSRRARQALVTFFPTAGPGRRRRVGRSGLDAGRSEAGRVDLGQRRFGSSSRALGA